MDNVYAYIRERFETRNWDPAECSAAVIRVIYDDESRSTSRLQRSGIAFAQFNVLYRRAACECVTLNWKRNRKGEKRVGVSKKWKGVLYLIASMHKKQLLTVKIF